MTEFNLGASIRRIGMREVRTVEEVRHIPGDETKYWIQLAVSIGKVARIMAAAALLGGCGPAVTMTVQVQDAQGNVKVQSIVTSTASGGFTVANGDNIIVKPTATYRYGLQAFWVEGSSDCTVCGAQFCTNQHGVLLAPPPVGNAIQPGTSPAQASFTANFGAVNCSGPFEMHLDAGATGNPSPGLFGGPWFAGGPSTTHTREAIFRNGLLLPPQRK